MSCNDGRPVGNGRELEKKVDVLTRLLCEAVKSLRDNNIKLSWELSAWAEMHDAIDEWKRKFIEED